MPLEFDAKVCLKMKVEIDGLPRDLEKTYRFDLPAELRLIAAPKEGPLVVSSQARLDDAAAAKAAAAAGVASPASAAAPAAATPAAAAGASLIPEQPNPANAGAEGARLPSPAAGAAASASSQSPADATEWLTPKVKRSRTMFDLSLTPNLPMEPPPTATQPFTGDKATIVEDSPPPEAEAPPDTQAMVSFFAAYAQKDDYPTPPDTLPPDTLVDDLEG